MIGRFSALACSDIVNVKSFYNGLCYSYLMYKDGASICIDKLSQLPTESENGVEVTVTIGNYDKRFSIKPEIQSGLEALSYFDKLYVEDSWDILDKDFVQNFNNRKIHEFESFNVISIRPTSSCRLLMGTVSYPIKSDLVDSILKINPKIDLVCNIGEVDVTPNREHLLYNTKTTNTIKKCLTSAKLEIQKILKSKFNGDFATIDEWYDFVSINEYTLTLYESEELTATITIPINLYREYGISELFTIKGVQIPKDLFDNYRIFKSMSLPCNLVTYSYYNDMFHTSKRSNYSIENFIRLKKKNKIVLLNEPYKPITKRYLSTQVNPYCSWSRDAILYINPTHWKIEAMRLIHNWYRYIKGNLSTKWFILDEFKSNYLTELKFFDNCDVPKSFKDSEKASLQTSSKTTARKCVVYTLCKSKIFDYIEGHPGIATDSYTFDSTTIGKFKGTVFYAEKDNMLLRSMFSLFRYYLPNYVCSTTKYAFVEVAYSNIKFLETKKNCYHINTILSKPERSIKTLATCMYLIQQYGEQPTYTGGNCDELLKKCGLLTLNNTLDDMWHLYIRLKEIKGKLKDTLTPLLQLYIENKWLNNDLISEIKLHPELMQLRKLLGNAQQTPSILYEIATAVIFTHHNKLMAQKKIFDSVKKILTSITQYQ